MTYEEMVLYLVSIAEAYPPDGYNGEEILDYISA